MFFTYLGRTAAVLALVLGTGMIASGMAIATEFIGPYEVSLTRYFPSAKSSGEVINKGMYMVVFGIVLGILTEIRSALGARPDSGKS